MTPLGQTLLTFAAPLGLGYAVRRISLAAGRGSEALVQFTRTQRWFQTIALSPITAILSLWVLDLSQFNVAALPLIGLAYHVAGALLALAAATWFQMRAASKGAYFMAGMVANKGMIGGLICFLLFGEQGYALASFYRLLELPVYYMVGYPVLSMYGRGERFSVQAAARQSLREPTIVLPIAGILIGVLLNLSGWDRPTWLGSLNGVLIPLTAVAMAFATGTSMRVASVLSHLRPSAVMVGIKFLVLPLLVAGLAMLAGLHRVDGGVPFRVAVILALTPVGFSALIPVTLYDLDEDLANAVWLTSMGVFGLLLPVILLVMG